VIQRMDVDSLDNRKFLVAGALVLVIGLAFFGLSSVQDDKTYDDTVPVRDNGSQDNQSDSSPEFDTEYSVDCPDGIMEHCVSVANEYEGDVSHMYEAEYTNMNGSKHFVRLVSDSEVADTGATNVTINFDADSGRVWNVKEAEQ
jgi:hypothetical protein